jgi:hypothetical protein
MTKMKWPNRGGGIGWDYPRGPFGTQGKPGGKKKSSRKRRLTSKSRNQAGLSAKLSNPAGKQNPAAVGHPMSRRPPLPFVIGETYADRVGEYKVISVEGKKMVFEYTNGRRCKGHTKPKALIYRNILLEEKFPHLIRPKKPLKP